MLKSVHLVSAFNKSLYLDRQSLAFRPNLVFVEPSGEIVFEINEIGLKGDARDAARKLVVVWGDSVVFGIGKGWPCLLDALAPGYQFLNGGIEGDHYLNILRRASAFNRQQDVALNLLMLGWHPFQRIRRRWTRRPANRTLRADLTAFLAETPNTVLLTMPTALNRKMLKQDLSGLVVTEHDPDRYFTFFGVARYSLSIQRETFDYIVERNTIAREVCASRDVRSTTCLRCSTPSRSPTSVTILWMWSILVFALIRRLPEPSMTGSPICSSLRRARLKPYRDCAPVIETAVIGPARRAG